MSSESKPFLLSNEPPGVEDLRPRQRSITSLRLISVHLLIFAAYSMGFVVFSQQSKLSTSVHRMLFKPPLISEHLS